MRTIISAIALSTLAVTGALAQTTTLSSEPLRASTLLGAPVHAAGEAEGDGPVGEVGDVLFGRDGAIDAVLIEMGGVLGLGARTVAVGMDELSVTNEDDAWRVAVTATGEDLSNRPEYEEGSINAGLNRAADSAAASLAAAGETVSQTADAAAEEAREALDAASDALSSDKANWVNADLAALTTATLAGVPVHDAADEKVGEIVAIEAGAGGTDRAVMDIGGFMGLDEHRVAVTLDEVTVMRDPETDALRAYVARTLDGLKALPAHEG